MTFLVFQAFDEQCDLQIPESTGLYDTVSLTLRHCSMIVHICSRSFHGFHSLKSVISIGPAKTLVKVRT